MSAATSARRAQRGFSLIELIVVVAILTVLAGATLPVVSRTLTRGKIADTRAELAALAPAISSYFEDTGAFPPTFGDLEQNVSGASHWTGPYLKALLASQPSSEMSLTKDAWNRAYTIALTGGSMLTISSAGQDGTLSTADDLVQVVDVTPVRRALTLTELRTINAAITSYNAINLPSSPLSTDYATLLATLTSGGYLPSGTTVYQTDGWGTSYVLSPAGVSPPVAATSSHF